MKLLEIRSGIFALSLLLTGCAAPPKQAPSNSQANSTPPPAERQPEPPPSALSYGMVTGRVKKGVTTQQELLELFGGPSVMTTDKDDTEVWMYDKTTTTVSGASKQTSRQTRQSDASAMATYFGIPLIAGVGRSNGSEKEQTDRENQNEVSSTSSVKTITFIIKFSADKTVKDYSVRQASY
jgi:hypothetical protein